MTEQEIKLALTEKEFKTYNSLVRLGDSSQLAFDTVINERKEEAIKESLKGYYKFAYEG